MTTGAQKDNKNDLLKLRELTWAGMMDCKQALGESQGDIKKAQEILRKKGLDIAKKKSTREAKEGQIVSYIHAGGKLGVIVEINCESDFVAKNEIFQAFARDVRRDFLLKIAQKIRATHVVLGHHLEDQVETVMGHLLRGSGLHGLGAMGPMVFFEKIPWVRPLLSFQKKELYAYARKEKIPFIEDSSNKTFKYHRNRLRQELIPQLEKLSKGSLKRIASLSETSRLWGECMSSLAEKELKKSGKKGASGLTLDRGHLISLPKALRQELFRQAYIQMTGGSADLKRDHLEKMEALCLGDRPRSTYRLPKGLQWVREKEKLLFLNNSLC